MEDDQFVFELTASAEDVVETFYDPIEFLPPTEIVSEEPQAEIEMPMDAAQYPSIDFSIPPELRNEHTARELWDAWYESALAHPELSGYGDHPHLIPVVYQLGLDGMS